MTLKSYLIFFLVFGVVPDLYICLGVLSVAALPWRLAVCLPTAAALVFLVRIASRVRYTDSLRWFSYLIFMAEFPKTVFMLFSLLLGLIPLQSRLATDLVAAGLGAGVGIFFAVMTFYATRHLVVGRHDLTFDTLPKGFDGLRLCQLSDMHLGSFGSHSKYIREIIDKTVSLGSELILFTGDLVNFSSEEALPYKEDLARVKAPLGVFSIRGNHDYLLHGSFRSDADREEDMHRLDSLETSLGWKLLLDDHAVIQRGGDSIAIAGVGNVSSNPYFKHKGGNLGKAMKGIPEDVFTILMTHDPAHWRRDVLHHGNVALTVAGHTHGLRYKLAGMNVSSWKFREYSGLYREGDRVLHVSEGLGSAFAFRLGGFPHINLITLHCGINR